MFSKSLFLAAGLLSASAAFSLPSKPVPGDPAIIPLPSALDVEKNKPGFLVSNTLPVSKTGDKSCIASFVTGFSNNLRQIKVSPAPSAANAVQIDQLIVSTATRLCRSSSVMSSLRGSVRMS